LQTLHTKGAFGRNPNSHAKHFEFRLSLETYLEIRITFVE
jgi:hypothetical protein